MKNLIKKFFCLMLIVITFAGCGTSTGNAITNKNKKIELTLYYPISVGGPLTKVVEKMCSDFTKGNPNIKVNAVYTGSYADTMVKAQTAVNGKNPPDMAVLQATELYTLLDMNCIQPLDDFITKDGGNTYINDFYPAFLENSKSNGKVWSIPFQRSSIVLYYNKDAFKAAGLNPENPPKSWDELVEDAQKLTKKGANGQITQYGLEIPSTDFQYWMFQALALENGKNIMSKDGKKVYFDTTANEKALQNWVDLAKKDQVSPDGIINWATTPSDFINGKTAMMYHTTGNLTNVKKNAKFNFGAAYLPAGKNYASPTGGGNIYMFKGISKDKQDAAWKFIRFATDPKRAAQWSIDTGYVATRKSAYETDILKNYIKAFPQATVARDQLKYCSAELSTHNNDQIYKIINDDLQAAITGKMTASDALKKAQQDAENILKSYNQ